MEGEAPDSFFDVLETLQGLLPQTGSAIGPWSLADVALAPMLVRLETMMANEFGKYEVGEGKKALEVLRGPRFARLSRYLEDVKQRPSVKATHNEVRYRVVRCVSGPFWTDVGDALQAECVALMTNLSLLKRNS